MTEMSENAEERAHGRASHGMTAVRERAGLSSSDAGSHKKRMRVADMCLFATGREENNEGEPASRPDARDTWPNREQIAAPDAEPAARAPIRSISLPNFGEVGVEVGRAALEEEECSHFLKLKALSRLEHDNQRLRGNVVVLRLQCRLLRRILQLSRDSAGDAEGASHDAGDISTSPPSPAHSEGDTSADLESGAATHRAVGL